MELRHPCHSPPAELHETKRVAKNSIYPQATRYRNIENEICI